MKSAFFTGIYQRNLRYMQLKIWNRRNNPVFNDKNLVSFDVKNIPATGFKTYIPILEPDKTMVPSALSVDEKSCQIENSFFSLKIIL